MQVNNMLPTAHDKLFLDYLESSLGVFRRHHVSLKKALADATDPGERKLLAEEIEVCEDAMISCAEGLAEIKRSINGE